jgi:ketosteroid isomerase-like protein
MSMTKSSDREQILAHIHSIFQAYLRKDRKTIRDTHTGDWTGFQGPSTRIERGIDAYMVNADKSLAQIDGTGYEILDHEVQVYGDIGIVYYIARYDYRDRHGREGSLPLRSVDIYRRLDGEWIQAGSHIGPLPAAGEWVSEKDEAVD